jgi:hypothetical protein
MIFYLHIFFLLYTGCMSPTFLSSCWQEVRIPHVCPSRHRILVPQMSVLQHRWCMSPSYTQDVCPPNFCPLSNMIFGSQKFVLLYTGCLTPHVFPPKRWMFVSQMFFLLLEGCLSSTCLSSYSQDVCLPDVCPPTNMMFVLPHTGSLSPAFLSH